jgi:thioester reductase-like protein
MSIGHTMVLPPPSTVSNGFSTTALLASTGATSLMTVPMILEEIANLPEGRGVEALLRLSYVAFGGGPLKRSIGEKLAGAGVKLLKNYGLTEVGPLGLIFNPTPDTDWNYFTLRPDIDFKLIELEDSTVENRTYQLVGCPAGWRETLEVQDKLVGNPNNPHEFNPVGRSDDLIILNTGEKVLPAVLESLLVESGLINAALTFGDGRFELGIIIEPTEPQQPDQYDDFKSKIWLLVTQAGEKMDNHARISSPSAIIVLPPGKKMLRSDKGSILRKGTIAMFEQEIEEVYMLLEKDTHGGEISLLDMTQLERSLRNLLQQDLHWKMSENEWCDQDDLFELGMDSLQATRLRRSILRSIPEKESSLRDRVGADIVYRFPSISMMADHLRSEASTDSSLSSRANLLQDYVDQFSTRIISIPPRAVILLTGGTGSLGSHLLAHLASLPDVAEIICLNRPHSINARARQEQAMAFKGIKISEIAWEKITVLQTNTAAPALGLQGSEYRQILDKVTHILHNAWTMDFNRSISSFKEQFKALQNLCNLALDANIIRPNIKPRILFTSSIGVVGQYNLIHGGSEVPEVRIDDAACTNEFGYGQAKLVCERILENISSRYPHQIEAGYVRVGQVSGSTTSGFWNSSEHLPALVKSSQLVGKLPPMKGLLSWLPVDLAAQSISELLLALAGYEKCMVFHLQNPVMQATDEVYDVILSKLGPDCSLAESFEEWLETVFRAPDKGTRSMGKDCKKDAASNPATKLAEFFRNDFRRMGDVVMGTAQARKLSPTLENMGPVSAETIGNYMDYWKREGFLS